MISAATRREVRLRLPLALLPSVFLVGIIGSIPANGRALNSCDCQVETARTAMGRPISGGKVASSVPYCSGTLGRASIAYRRVAGASHAGLLSPIPGVERHQMLRPRSIGGFEAAARAHRPRTFRSVSRRSACDGLTRTLTRRLTAKKSRIRARGFALSKGLVRLWRTLLPTMWSQAVSAPAS